MQPTRYAPGSSAPLFRAAAGWSSATTLVLPYAYADLRARVRAAFRAAAARSRGPLVRTPFRAAAERSLRVRRRAADLAWRARARREAAACPAWRSTRPIARDRFADGLC